MQFIYTMNSLKMDFKKNYLWIKINFSIFLGENVKNENNPEEKKNIVKKTLFKTKENIIFYYYFVEKAVK